MKHLFKSSLLALALAANAGHALAQQSETGLKDAYKDYFSIGVAVNMRNISEPDQIALIKKDFNSIKKYWQAIAHSQMHLFPLWYKKTHLMFIQRNGVMVAEKLARLEPREAGAAGSCEPGVWAG